MELALVAEKMFITQYIKLRQEKRKMVKALQKKVQKYEELVEIQVKKDEINDLLE